MAVPPLRLYRERKGLSQEALAAALGVRGNTVSRWECGRRMPRREFWPLLRSVTGIPYDELLSFEADTAHTPDEVSIA